MSCQLKRSNEKLERGWKMKRISCQKQGANKIRICWIGVSGDP